MRGQPTKGGRHRLVDDKRLQIEPFLEIRPRKFEFTKAKNQPKHQKLIGKNDERKGRMLGCQLWQEEKRRQKDRQKASFHQQRVPRKDKAKGHVEGEVN